MSTTLRSAQVATDLAPRAETARSFFRRADRINARYAIYVGPREVETGLLLAKDLRSGEQLSLADLPGRIGDGGSLANMEA